MNSTRRMPIPPSPIAIVVSEPIAMVVSEPIASAVGVALDHVHLVHLDGGGRRGIGVVPMSLSSIGLVMVT